ncbi:MAG: ferritin [Bacteroides sp.]|nr:ferritin [Bacteroidales bacterium]MBD5317567.1 ferritin [Bacteroides sp.]MBD5376961.1 ferritin [Bacteroides sp.]
MLSEKMEAALNEQINAELWSAYLYLSMAMQFESDGLPGVANWFKIQFKEEQAHAEIFMNYINARGGRVTLRPIAEVPVKWASPLEAFKDTLAHEQKVTALINNLFALAEAEHDYATRDRMAWFVNEQVEEEDNARTLIDKFTLIGNDGMGLYMLNQELAARVYTAPSILQGE